jgi:hypothetical protein
LLSATQKHSKPKDPQQLSLPWLVLLFFGSLLLPNLSAGGTVYTEYEMKNEKTSSYVPLKN